MIVIFAAVFAINAVLIAAVLTLPPHRERHCDRAQVRRRQHRG